MPDATAVPPAGAAAPAPGGRQGPALAGPVVGQGAAGGEATGVAERPEARGAGSVVSIHQPNFAPWTGFFDKLAGVGTFVLLDTVPYSKGSYANRVHLLGRDGPQWLTVPVLTKGRLGQPTDQVELNEAKDWRTEHLRTITSLYGRAPYVGWVRGLLEPVYEAPHTLLADLCVDLLERVVGRLGYPTRLVRASTLDHTGSASGLLASLVAQVGGTTYVSGPSGRSYLDETLFVARGIEVVYHAYTPRPYDQGGRPFVPRLSVLDALAWTGPDAADALRSA